MKRDAHLICRLFAKHARDGPRCFKREHFKGQCDPSIADRTAGDRIAIGCDHLAERSALKAGRSLDLLGLGNEAKMNMPGTVTGNWQWRLKPGQLTKPLAKKLAQEVRLFGRQ